MGILRILLALLVVNSHTNAMRYTSFLDGGTAVQVFFAISGFYMALVLNGKYTQTRDFYINRYLRLYPSYLAVLIASIAWFGVITWYTHQLPPPFWIYRAEHQMAWWQWALLQFSNVTMLGLDVPSLFHWSAQKGFLFLHYNSGDTAPDGAEWCGYLAWIRQAWSIGAELWFYMLAPFLVRQRWTIQATLLFASLAIKIAMEVRGFSSYYFFPANLWLFMTGSLLFASLPAIVGWGRRVALPVIIAVVLVCSLGGLVQNPAIHWGLVLFLILSVPVLFARFSKSSWDNAVGELSYPVYLLHLLVIAVLKTGFHVTHPIAAAVLTVILAIAMVRIVEEPVNRYRQRRHSKASGEVVS